MTALMLAAKNNDIKCVKELRASEIMMRTDNGETALGFAVQNSNKEIMKLLSEERTLLAPKQLSKFQKAVGKM